jgi:hypothetical protein
MEQRDMVLLIAALLLAIVVTWAGTDYVVDHVVLPLAEDEPAPGRSDLTPRDLRPAGAPYVVSMRAD